MNRILPFAALTSIALAMPVAISAQEDAALRTRVALGPQLVPSYPGSDEMVLRPLFDLSRARGDDQIAFEAPDESFGFALVRSGDWTLGPSGGFQGRRSREDVGGALPRVGFSVELGGFVQWEASEQLRLRAEARQAVSGHDGFISVVSADWVMREGDRQLFSVGPRVTITDSTYQNAYFGVRPEDAAVSGLAAYDADGGVQSVGGAAGYLRQFSPRWGMFTYLKYDRLVGDPADSPVLDAFGSRDQFSGGIALTYTFGRNVE